MKPDQESERQELIRLRKRIQELEAANRRHEKKSSAMLNLMEDIENAKLQLEASEYKYRTLSEASPEMIYLIDSAGFVRHVNKTAAQALGHSPDQIIGRHLRDLFPPDLAERHLRDIKKVLRTGETLTHELLETFPNGSRWIDARLTPIKNESGKWSLVLGLSQDISDRKRTEEALKDSEARYRTLVESSPDAITYTDLQGRVLVRNHQAELWFGPLHAEGQQAPNAFQSFTPEDRQRAAENLRLVLEKGGINAEYTLLKKDGTPFPAELNSALVRDGSGRPSGFVAMTRDISERKRTEKALRESEEKYKALVEATDTGYVIVDEQGRVLDANMNYVHLSGHYSLKDILNRSVTEWTAPYDKERNGREVAKCLENGFVYDLEIDYILRDGRIVPVEVNAHVVKTEQGVRIVTLCRNISKRKRELETLRESEEKFRLMAEHLMDVLFTTDLKGVLTYVSPSVEKIFGFKNDQIHGRLLTDLLPQNEKTKTRQVFRKTLDSFAPIQNLNLTFKRKTGVLFSGELTLSPIVLNEGISCVVGLIRDIQKRSRMDEELRESELKFRSFIEQSAEGLIIADNQGRIVEWNRALEKITGLKKSETSGSKLWEVQHEVTRTEHRTPKQLKRVKAEILDMLRTGKPLFGDRTVEVAIQRKDGELRQIQQTVFTFLINKETWIGTVMNDITERKRVEETLRNNEIRYRELIDSLPLIIFEYDTNANLTYSNQRAFQSFGYSPEDLRKGFSVAEGIAPKDRARASASIAKMLAGKTVRDEPYTAIRRDGKTFTVQVHSSPIIVDGQVKGIRGVLIDTSDLENLRAALGKTELKLKRFERLAAKQDQNMQKLKEQIAAWKAHIGRPKKERETHRKP